MRYRWYIGHIKGQLKPEAFRLAADLTPTRLIYAQYYYAVTGPFKTRRAALWAQEHGALNPHFQHVSDAERLSKVQPC